MKGKAKITFIVVLSIFCLLFLVNLYHAHAGCGCDKPAPPPAPIIPDAAYPGSYVRIYSSAIAPGATYGILFNQTATSGVAEIDREGRKRIKVMIPETDDIGPASVTVLRANGKIVMNIGPNFFTLIAKPIKIHDKEGIYNYNNFTCAVDLTGTIIIAFDLTGITQPLNFIGKFADKKLELDSSEDIVFFNIQGYLMTDMATYELPYHIPGLNKIIKSSDDSSDMVLYWRHEFETYYEAHMPGHPHERDPLDPDYHLDGTPCVDHDHIIMKVAAHYADGTNPLSGSIDKIKLRLGVFSDTAEISQYIEKPDAYDFEEYYESN